MKNLKTKHSLNITNIETEKKGKQKIRHIRLTIIKIYKKQKKVR